MKSTFYLLILFLLIASCTHKVKDNTIRLQLKVLEKVDRESAPPGICHSIQVELVNNTDSLFSCWLMTCSWTDNFIFNSDSLQLYIPACDGNSPVVYEIRPGKQLTLLGECMSTYKWKPNENIKLGLVLIREQELSYLNFFNIDSLLNSKIKNKRDIIWSDPIKRDEMIKLLSK